jgi:hypothetical protein
MTRIVGHELAPSIIICLARTGGRASGIAAGEPVRGRKTDSRVPRSMMARR